MACRTVCVCVCARARVCVFVQRAVERVVGDIGLPDRLRAQRCGDRDEHVHRHPLDQLRRRQVR